MTQFTNDYESRPRSRTSDHVLSLSQTCPPTWLLIQLLPPFWLIEWIQPIDDFADMMNNIHLPMFVELKVNQYHNYDNWHILENLTFIEAACKKHNRQVEQKPGGRGRGRGREWATLGVHPLFWLLSNNRLEKVPFVSVPHTSSNRLLLSNQDKGCTPSVAHSLALPLGPALLNLWIVFRGVCMCVCFFFIFLKLLCLLLTRWKEYRGGSFYS